MSGHPSLFIVTYRDDELSRDHPLWSVVGDLPGKAVTRLKLVPLSEQAVVRLAQEARRPTKELYAITGGNPFFVTEVLSSDTPGVPLTVRDAVLARVTRLSPAAHALLELASVVPTRTERWFLEDILGSAAPALEECFSSGMLTLDQTMVAFRHELAHQAVVGIDKMRDKEAIFDETNIRWLLSERRKRTGVSLYREHAVTGAG